MTPSFDLSRYQDPLTIQRVLHGAKTIAIVGLSKNQLRASYFVAFYLRRHGYRVIPVNPREPEILGEKSFSSLVDVPVSVDIVNVFRAPDALARFIAPKGSVALNGTSLTVNEVEGSRFGVNLIPHTRTATTWGEARVGDKVNLEIDTLARYVARLAEAAA